MGFSSRFKRNENFFKILFFSILVGFTFFIFKEIITLFTISNSIPFWFAYIIMLGIPLIIGLYQTIKIEIKWFDMKINLFILILIFSITFTTNQSAKELLIFADTIDYDSKNTLIAKGNVKLISGDEILTSNLVIIKEDENIIQLPNAK